jgi:hypothetical protein
MFCPDCKKTIQINGNVDDNFALYGHKSKCHGKRQSAEFVFERPSSLESPDTSSNSDSRRQLNEPDNSFPNHLNHNEFVDTQHEIEETDSNNYSISDEDSSKDDVQATEFSMPYDVDYSNLDNYFDIQNSKYYLMKAYLFQINIYDTYQNPEKYIKTSTLRDHTRNNAIVIDVVKQQLV